jgi:hypothetical protein
MLVKHNIDLNFYKPFGPVTATGLTDEKTQKVVNGRDGFFMDSCILRFCNGRRFNMDSIITDMYYHFCWR